MAEKTVILLDGGFVKKKLRERNGSFPTTEEILALCRDIMSSDRLKGTALFRVYYYDAPPLAGQSTNPVDGSLVDFSATSQFNLNRQFIDSLELEPDFAVRRGHLIQSGWKLGRMALSKIRKATEKSIEARDLVPDISQKGVDIRIGLDIASLALKRVVDNLVLVTGDSDFVPAMKLARKEGLKVYLEAMGHGVRRELKAHADLVL
jgi:uncharacterized LabA/DUF88 family protein